MDGESQASQENLAFNNRNLFSNHYLLNLIQGSPEWKKKDHVEAFNAIKRAYTSQSAFFDGLNEAQLEERFYKNIFKKILPFYEVQERSGSDKPDYAFFADQETIDDAHRSVETKSFFAGALAVGDVKQWDVELDKFGKDRQDKRRNPSFQMWLYLNDTGVNWGILSMGKIGVFTEKTSRFMFTMRLTWHLCWKITILKGSSIFTIFSGAKLFCPMKLARSSLRRF